MFNKFLLSSINKISKFPLADAATIIGYCHKFLLLGSFSNIEMIISSFIGNKKIIKEIITGIKK